MIAYRLVSPGSIDNRPLQPRNLVVPDPGQGQVRIKVSVCGVCSTDLLMAEGDLKPPNLPITLGHHVIGVVDALGSSSKNKTASGVSVGVGDRVGVPWLYSTCGRCEYCKRGEENLCTEVKYTGFHVDGGYAEYLIAEASSVLPIPVGIGDEQAAPLLCSGIGGYRSLKKARVHPGEHVGLFGFGTSANMCSQLLQYWGCQVSVFTRAFSQQQHAREFGAKWAGSAGQNPGKPLDRVVIFAPTGALVVRALELVRPGGVVVVNTMNMSTIPSFPYYRLKGERTLCSVENITHQDGMEFLVLAGEIGIRSEVRTYALNDVNQALGDLKNTRFNGEAILKIG